MTAASSQPVRGSRFPTLEKYDVIEELGHGGMATVYRARDLRLGRDVAVKVIHPHLRDSVEAVRRFSIEARAVAKLRHPNIVEVYDVSAATDPEQYLVVELLRGVTLRRLLEQHGALPAEIAASIAVELLAALAHAHDVGVIHRDVKPENVILEHRARPAAPGEPSSPDAATSGSVAPAAKSSHGSETQGDRITIKLTDFGIAKLLDAQGVTSTGQVLGSPAHMAPEQIEGREVDARADVFGIGVLMYECMVGHLPFQGTNPAQVLRRVLESEYASAEQELPTIGRTWSRILDQALASAMEDRFAGAPQMRDVVMRELGRLGVTSPRGEIEAWLDDPEGFAAAHGPTMTARLCARAEEASRRGDVLTAAADYNRALAYSPNDGALLKLVSRMNRRSARRDALKRAMPAVLVSLVLVAGGVALAKAWTHRAPQRPLEPFDPPMTFARDPVAPPVVAPMSFPPEISSAVRTLARPAVSVRPPPPKPTSHEVRFTSVEPAQGVRVAIDGASAISLDPSKPIVLDDKAHSLTFSCQFDLCDPPLTRTIEPGDRPVALAVRLTIKPARLLIHGNPANHYTLSNDPGRRLDVGDVATEIPMTHEASRVVKVVEQETGQFRMVDLYAGKVSKPVDFVSPP